MIVFGDAKTTVKCGDALSVLAALDGRERLIACGMMEQALADAGESGFEELTDLAARGENGEFARKMKELEPGLDREIDLHIPEGFAFYGVAPDQYATAARDWGARNDAREAAVIGIRTIGTTLSAVVAETLRSLGRNVRRCTVRPEGDPFHRSSRLPEWVDSKAGACLVVDEGPGLSGSSFVSVFAALRERGVPKEQIHFFPAHGHPPGAAASLETLRVWAEVPKWLSGKRHSPGAAGLDWEFAGWPLPWPFDCSGEAGRFARRAAEVSCGVPVLEARDGWLGYERIRGEPAQPRFVEIARHISAVSEAPWPRKIEHETENRLREMLEANVRKRFQNDSMSQALRRWLESLEITPMERSSGDGAIGPENWIRDASGRLWKRRTTGRKLSHAVAHQLPVLWDVAQWIVEWDLSREAEMEARSRLEPWRIYDAELGFFKMTVAALGLGHAVLAGAESAVKSRWERRLLRAMGEQLVW